MANRLKMEKKQTVLALLKLGWSYRRIERETGVRRETIARYDPSRDSKAAKWPPGVRSRCEPFREEIEKKLQQRLQAKRIWKDLVFEHGFDGAYNSVKRFCRKLKAESSRVFARVETPPGRDMQIDFGKSKKERETSGVSRAVGFQRQRLHMQRIDEESPAEGLATRSRGKHFARPIPFCPPRDRRVSAIP